MTPTSHASCLSQLIIKSSWFSTSLPGTYSAIFYHHQLGLMPGLFFILILCIHVYLVYFWLYWVLVAAQAVLYLWQVRATV